MRETSLVLYSKTFEKPLIWSTTHYIQYFTIHASGKIKSEIEHKLQSDANETKVWSIINKLPIHYGKSTTMTLGTRHKIQQARQLNISIGNTQLNRVSSRKLLGVHIDETLSWNQHIDYLRSIITSKISFLRQMSDYDPENVQKMFYQSFVLPLIDYGKSSWGSTTKLNIERINKLQKRVAHIILRWYRTDHHRLRAKKVLLPPPPREFCRLILSRRKFQAASFKRCLHSVLRGVCL